MSIQIFVCGDSTAASYDPEKTCMVGWGQLLGEYLPEAKVVNLAMAGRSTRTFLEEKRLEPAEEQARPGDLVLIQFAHNDENEKKPERYAAPWTDFRENLRIFVRRARAKGAVPVFLTPICMRIWEGGALQPTHGEYPAVMHAAAEEMQVPLIDLYTESFRIVQALGEEGSKTLFMHTAPGEDPAHPEGQEDNAHTRRAGAERFAAYTARQLRAQGLLPPSGGGKEETGLKYCLAVDIGASSGRHIVGWEEGGEIRTQEVYRFPNGVTEQDGHLVWDVEALEKHVKAGIGEALKAFPKIESLSVDTWGVDYVLMNGDEPILPCYAYRDSRTAPVIGRVHEKMPFAELYRRTGIQFQPFNTVYQLCADKLAGRLEKATGFLMMPEYLMFRLTGAQAHEYTNATTGGMVSAQTGTYDEEIIRALELPRRLFTPLQQPGTVIGSYRGIPVMLCATHDTGSAVEGIPMEGNELYISSGTWSLLGVKTPRPLTDEASRDANYSNEGGVGYNRYQKNLMGMWLANRLRAELCPEKPWDEITAEAERSDFDPVVDVNDPVFLAPESMKAAFDAKFPRRPENMAGYFRCAYRSLALSYMTALEELERNTGMTYDRLYIVGGGAKNAFLNRLTEEASGKKVIALPIEATAIGNLKIQIRSDLS